MIRYHADAMYCNCTIIYQKYGTRFFALDLIEEILQPEAERKQAGWVKMSKSEEMLQPEAARKQVGWVKMPKREEMPQQEANKTSR